jgi:uncharacterized membrane protein (DUF2068 family)
MTELKKPSRRTAGLILIALFKLLKATTLILVAVGAFHLVHHDVADSIGDWAISLGFDPDGRLVRKAVAYVGNVNDEWLKRIGVGAIGTAILFLIEGGGLLTGQRWAEYMTVTITSLLIPLEIYEIVQHTTWVRIGTLAINLVAVAYLIWLLRRQHRTEAVR